MVVQAVLKPGAVGYVDHLGTGLCAAHDVAVGQRKAEVGKVLERIQQSSGERTAFLAAQ